MKVDYRRSTAAYKTSHRCQFSLRVGSRVNHSRGKRFWNPCITMFPLHMRWISFIASMYVSNAWRIIFDILHVSLNNLFRNSCNNTTSVNPRLCHFQMSGRAGRRGFDLVGNVIFFGIPYRKIQRLMTANIPKLVGNFPITVSLVLRLLLMTTQADDKKDALTKVSKDSFEWIFNSFLFFQ